MDEQPPWSKIVYFDGICILCNHAVDLLIRIDRRRKLKYATLQSGMAKKHLPGHLLDKPIPNTVVFIDQERIFLKTSAILQVLRSLGFPWSLFVVCYIVPARIRDRLYDYLASKRYSWFGKRPQCRVPDEITRDRILE